MKRDRARFAVYGLAGVYLLYLVYEMVQGLNQAGEEKNIMLIFSVLFGVIGVGLIGAAVYKSWQFAKEAKQEQEMQQTIQPEEEDTAAIGQQETPEEE